MQRSMMALAACAVACLGAVAGAHELSCKQTFGPRSVAVVRGELPSTLLLTLEVRNELQDAPSTVRSVEAPLLEHLGLRFPRAVPFSLPPASSERAWFTLEIPGSAACRALAGPDGIVDSVVVVRSDTGSARCSARIICGEPPPDAEGGPTRNLGFYKTHPQPLQACLGIQTACPVASGFALEGTSRPPQCVGPYQGELQHVFPFHATNTGAVPLHGVRFEHLRHEQFLDPVCLFADGDVRFLHDPAFGFEPLLVTCSLELAPDQRLDFFNRVITSGMEGEDIVCQSIFGSALDPCGRQLTGQATVVSHLIGWIGDQTECVEPSDPDCPPGPAAPPAPPPRSAPADAGPVRLGAINVDSLEEALGLLWGSPAQDASGQPRTPLDRAKFLLARQTLVGTCNQRLFDTAPPAGLLDQAASALNGGNEARLLSLERQIAAYNESGTGLGLPPGFVTGAGSATGAARLARDPTSSSSTPGCARPGQELRP